MRRVQWIAIKVLILFAGIVMVAGAVGAFLVPSERLAFGLFSKVFLVALGLFGLLLLWLGLVDFRLRRPRL